MEDREANGALPDPSLNRTFHLVSDGRSRYSSALSIVASRARCPICIGWARGSIRIGAIASLATCDGEFLRSQRRVT